MESSVTDVAPDCDVTRISVDPADVGFRDDYRNFAVFLNGERVPFLRTADKNTGEVLSTAVDANGQPIIEGDEFLIIRKIGKVEIQPLPNPLASSPYPTFPKASK